MLFGKATKAKVAGGGPYDFVGGNNGEEGNEFAEQEGTDPSCKVLVSGLNSQTELWRLKDHFEQVGQVVFSKMTGLRSPGTAMVEYTTADEAQSAREMLTGTELDGHNLVVGAWDERNRTAGQVLAGGGDANKVCPYFAQGKCNRGAECKWIHSLTGMSTASQMGQLGGQQQQICPYFLMGKCLRALDCKWVHPTGAGPVTAKVCPYFPLGKCDKGAQCKWVHTAAPGMAAGVVPAMPVSMVCPVVPMQSGNMAGQKVCPYFPLGKCNKGAECKWIHTGPAGDATGAAAGGTKVCPYFPLGKCDKGTACKWIH